MGSKHVRAFVTSTCHYNGFLELSFVVQKLNRIFFHVVSLILRIRCYVLRCFCGLINEKASLAGMKCVFQGTNKKITINLACHCHPIIILFIEYVKNILNANHLLKYGTVIENKGNRVKARSVNYILY